MGGLGQGRTDGGCSGGCNDRYRPMCVEGVCKSPNCSDITAYCKQDSLKGFTARKYCPQSCGCSSPTSANLMTQPANGCGSACATTTTYREQLAQLPCADVGVNAPAMRSYREELFQLLSGWYGMPRHVGAMVTRALMHIGCAALPAIIESSVSAKGLGLFSTS